MVERDGFAQLAVWDGDVDEGNWLVKWAVVAIRVTC